MATRLYSANTGANSKLRRSNNTVAEHGRTVYLTRRLRFLNGRRGASFNYKLSAALVLFKDKQATAQ
jgi:hypothetical protein